VLGFGGVDPAGAEPANVASRLNEQDLSALTGGRNGGGNATGNATIDSHVKLGTGGGSGKESARLKELAS
jgi:hypothetical protein